MKCFLCNVCFILGDLVSKCDRLSLSNYEWFVGIWYPIYNILMGWSIDLDDSGDCGIWDK